MGRATFTINDLLAVLDISIHALRGEGDIFTVFIKANMIISIHALRGEGDSFINRGAVLQKHFYPRPPWGGRPFPPISPKTKPQFLSTPSVGRATQRPSIGSGEVQISIHALRGEGDVLAWLVRGLTP